MRHPLISLVSVALFLAPAALTQDCSTAFEMAERCASMWAEFDSVRCEVEVVTELPTGRTVAAGECLFVGGRTRQSVVDSKTGWTMLVVKDRCYAWTEMRVPGDRPVLEIVKDFRGHFDYKHETLIGMVASTPILLHPSLIFNIVVRNYDLEFGSKRAEGKILLLDLEGDLKPESLVEDLNRTLSADEQAVIKRLGRCRLSVRAHDFIPVRVDFFGDAETQTASYSLRFTQYAMNHPFLEPELCYTPPKKGTVTDLAAKLRKGFRLSFWDTKPELPRANGSAFQPVSDEMRVDVLVLPDGFYKVAGRKYGDFDSIYGALRWASTVFGRYRDAGSMHLTDADVVIYADLQSDIRAIFTLLMAGSTDTVAIDRYYLAAQDAETGSEGYLPFFLPASVGVVPEEASTDPAGPERYEVSLGSEGAGPTYTVTVMSSSEASTYTTLDDLASALEAIRAKHPSALIGMGLVAISSEHAGNERRPVTVQHLSDYLDLLAAQGADLMGQDVNARKEIDEIAPLESE